MSNPRSAWLLIILLAALFAAACIAPRQVPAAPPVPIPAAALNQSLPPPNYGHDIQPIFNSRCIACHGCLGSPCNVKLDSFAGADRGGFGINPYSGHLAEVPRTDMDAAATTAAWRTRGFYPVLGQCDSPAQRLDGSLMYRVLAAGTAFNQPGFSRQALAPLSAKRYANACPADTATLEGQLTQNPARGMPFGLPAIERTSFETLARWIGAGAPGPTDAELETADRLARPAAVARWEAFFNASDARGRLVSRFIFEHVFLASLVLEDSPGERFRLVRSSTPPGQPVMVIGTGLPYDDPYRHAGVSRFWYRLQKVTSAPVQKNHFVWHLKRADIAHLKDLFLGPGVVWDAAAPLDPPWGIGNPFLVFRAIPAPARSRFLLENSELIVSGITYGPVCLGQTATYAVKDQFWVYFLDPSADPSVLDPDLGLSTWKVFMDRSARGDAAYDAAYAKALAQLRPQGWSVDSVWDGGRKNPNAWLTVMRHDTNVSVVQGRQGGTPLSYWLIDYSGFERMYYDTVAGFAYWQGDLGKLQTLRFFHYLREEFQDNFLLLLPPGERERVRHTWNQGVGSYRLAPTPFAWTPLPEPVAGPVETPEPSAAAAPLAQTVAAIARRLGPTIAGPTDRLNPDEKPTLPPAITSFADWERAIAGLTVVSGQAFTRYLPSVIVLRLRQSTQSRVYSLVINRVYKATSIVVFANNGPLLEQFSLSVYPTIVNGFPNLFVDLTMDQAGGFIDGLRGMRTAADWTPFKARHGILRNNERLWPFYDWINEWNFRSRGAQAGYLDLTYYDVPE